MNADPERRPLVNRPEFVEHEESEQAVDGLVRHESADVTERGAEHREAFYDDVAGRQFLWASKMAQVVWVVIGIIEALIVLRMLLRVLDANPAAGFVNFIYGSAGIFLAPFFNAVGSPAVGGSVLEVADLFAFLVYLLIGWLFVKLIWLLVYRPPTGGGSRYRRFWT